MSFTLEKLCLQLDERLILTHLHSSSVETMRQFFIIVVSKNGFFSPVKPIVSEINCTFD